MAKPVVKTKTPPSKAPPAVRKNAKKGSVSSRGMKNAKAVRSGGLEYSGLPTINFDNVNFGNYVVTSQYTANVTSPTPDTPPAASSKFYIRSFATESATSLQRVTYVFPVSPNEISVNRVPIVYSEINRPGRKPILKSASKQLKQVTATLMVVAGDKSFLKSAQPQIDALEALSLLDYDLNIFYPGIDPSTKWRITDLSFRTVRRDTSNVVTLAESNITFTEVVTLPAPVPGMPRIKDVPASRRSTTNPGASSDNQRTGEDPVAIVLAAGPKPNNPGGTGFTVTTTS
jgi:hypothetical protein